MRSLTLLVFALLLTACSNPSAPPQEVPGPDANEEVQGQDFMNPPDLGQSDLFAPDTNGPDTLPEIEEEVGGPACEPGEGCFLDPCAGNEDCDSGWCVGYMGEDVCTVECQTECAQGWSCQQVPGTAPDVIWLCVSMHANLCLPCAAAADCKGAAGVDDACLDYGAEGSFCGGGCETDGDCPWGFSCADTVTVEGVELTQCVADAGVCPCTSKSVDLGLTTPCEFTNDYGTCDGLRACTEEGLTACDALVPAAEVCNGLDDDCDGETDEPNVVDGGYEDLCDDGNDCTADGCDGVVGCTHDALSEGECVDGDVCTVGDHCEAGICVGSPVACDDGNPCTDDLCDGLGGCEFVANSEACDDGDPCTVADQCEDQVCVGFPVNCDCQEDGDCAALEDGDLCNGTLVCDMGSLPYRCEVDPETLVTCPEPTEGPNSFCLAGVCDPSTGTCSVGSAHEGLPCDDGDLCTLGDHCAAGACVGGGAPSCDDGNPCTGDSCDPVAGCEHDFLDLACDDGNLCTPTDQCVNGLCQGGGILDCDDSNLCTTDGCDPVQGCVHLLNDHPCDDGDLCTQGDHCHLGACIGGGALPCDDGNLCTDDSCNSLTGCQFVPNAAACDDGNQCTSGDLCQNGWCLGGQIKVCDDGNICTDDGCDPLSGCTSTPNAAPCDDGDPCTVTDGCSGGACVGVGLLPCDDGDDCTADACVQGQGCVFTPISPCCGNGQTEVGEECDDGNEVDDDGCTNDCALPAFPRTVPGFSGALGPDLSATGWSQCAGTASGGTMGSQWYPLCEGYGQIRFACSTDNNESAEYLSPGFSMAGVILLDNSCDDWVGASNSIYGSDYILSVDVSDPNCGNYNVGYQMYMHFGTQWGCAGVYNTDGSGRMFAYVTD